MRVLRQAIVTVLIFVPFTLSAQSVELAVVGGGMFSSGASSTGAVEGSLAYRFFGVPMASLYFELPVAAGFEKSLGVQTGLTCTNPCNIITKYSSLMVGPGVKLKLAGALPVSPFLSFGGGVAHFSETLASGSNTSNNSALVQYGGGLDVKIAPFFSVRGEVRDYNSGRIAGTGGRQHNVLAGAGIVLRF
jgi:hypothetical protein